MANSPYDLPDDYESPYQAMASIDIVAIKKGLEEESASKTRALAEAKVRQEQRDNAYEATLAGILGLKGAAAISSDVLARVGNSVGMVLGAALGGATKLAMSPITSAVTDEDIAAYNRIQTGKTLPGDEDRMQSTFIGGGDYTVRDILQLGEDTDSWVRALNDNARPAPTLDAHQDQFVEDLQDSAGTKEALNALQEGTWEGAGDGALASTAGVGKAIWELSKNAVVAGANNPVATLQYIVDNSAQFALGAYSKPLLAAFTTGYATDYYTKGVKAYADAHEGQLPVGDDHTAILAKAASLGLAEYVGTAVSVGAAAIPRSIVQDVTAASGESLLKRALKGANERIGDAVSKAGGAFYGEALTEGYQTGVEGDLMGKPASAMDIYTGAAIGGLTGGTIATPAATASLTLGATEAARARSEAIAEAAQARKAELEEAIKTGNVTAYTDKTSPKYDPLKAVEILQGIASDDKRTATERDDAVTKAHEVFDTVSADLRAVRADLKQQGIVETSPKDVAEALKATKALAEELLAKEPDRDMTNIDKEIARLEKARAAVKTREVARQLQSVQKLGKTLDTIRPMIQELGVAVSRKPAPAGVPTPVTSAAALSTQSASPVASNEGSEDWLTEDEEWNAMVREAKANAAKYASENPGWTQEEEWNAMVREAKANSSKTSSEDDWWTPEEIEEFQREAIERTAKSTAPNEAANTKSTASEWLIKSITDMGAMEPDKARELADDTTNDLTNSQRTYLRRYSEARLAQNALMNVQGVNRAILSGDPRFGDLGLSDYRTRVAHAVKTGNTRQQRYYTDMLGRWLAYHKSKTAAATRAYNKLKDVEEFRHIAPDENNVWQEVDVRDIPKSQQLQMGVMAINLTRSRKLLPVMGQEVQAIQAAYEELEAMTALGESQSAPVASKPAVAPAKAQEATPASANTQAPVKQESAPKAQPEVTQSAVEKVPVEEAPKEPVVVQEEAAPEAEQQAAPAPVRSQEVTPEFEQTKLTAIRAMSDADLKRHLKTLTNALMNEDSPRKARVVEMITAEQEARASLAQETAEPEDVIDPKVQAVLEGQAEPALVDQKYQIVSKFNLNNGQKNAFQGIMNFLGETATNTYALIGSAGTGKTTIVDTVLASMGVNGMPNRSIILSAPTHRANAVTRSKNDPSILVMTLHSLLGLTPEDESLFDDGPKKTGFTMGLDQENKYLTPDTLLIVDESSMIDDALYAALMDAVAKEPGIKVLFLGDAAQLKPVNQTTVSKALTATQNKSELTKVERAKNASLLVESVHVRTKGQFSATTRMEDDKGVAFTNDESTLLDGIVQMLQSPDFATNRMLARLVTYQNKLVTKYNKYIRNKLHNNPKDPFVVGDLLMGYNTFGEKDENSGLSKLNNGLDYMITAVGSPKTSRVFGIPVQTVNITVQDTLKLQGAQSFDVALPNQADVMAEVGKKVNAELFKARIENNPARKQQLQQTIKAELSTVAWSEDVVATIENKKTGKTFQKKVINKHFDYGYAHTIHKSQGGTYKYVFVDNKSIRGEDTAELRYVGMTRAQEGAFILTSQPIVQGKPIPNGKAKQASENGSAMVPGGVVNNQPEVIEPVQEDAAPVVVQEETKPDAVTDIVAAQTEAEIAEQTIVEDVVPEAPKPQVGTLRALNDATNTEAQGFTQQTGDAGYPRPLTTVVDFLQSWKANASSFIYGFISEKKGELAPEQMLAIKTLYKYLTAWTPLVDKLFIDNDQTHIGRSLYKMFVTTVTNEDGSESYVMEENVKVAIVTAILNYIQDQNGMTYLLTDKEINGVLGRKEEDYVNNEEREKYQLVGEFRQKVITTMGKDIISMLGVGINSTTPINKLSKMESSLGTIALHLLTYVGSVKTHGVTLPGSTEKTPFVQFRNVWGKGTENNDEILAMNAAIAQSSKGSQSIIARLMGMEEVNREPTLKPEKTTQRDMSVAYQEVPTEHLKHLNEMNKTENYVDAAMMRVMQKLSPETQDVMIGTEYDGGATGEGIQKTRLLSIRAANDNLRRNWQNALGFWNTVLKQDGEKPFFLKHMPWTQGRAGIGQNVLNPNADKIARRLVTRRSWQSKIDLDNPVAVNGFMIAVAAALHIDIDKKSHETALQDTMVKLGWDGTAKGIQTLKNPKYQDAIAALQDMIFEDIPPSSEQEDAVISAVLDGEENMHSLQALVALAEMRHAVMHKHPNFITKLTLEVDGVTNGPMLTLLLWGGFHDPRVLEMGGFFQKWSTHEDYNVRRGLPGNKDLYETIAAKLAKYLRLLVSDQQKRVLNAVYSIVGQLEKDGVATSSTRKMVKRPLTQLFFGSGLFTIKKTIQNTVVDAFYQKLERAVADYQSGADVQSLKKITEALNDLLYRKVKTSKKGAKVPTFTVYDERMDLNHPKITENRAEFWLNFEMTPKQLTVFRANIEMTLGEATSAVLEDSFGSVIETKQLISRASEMSFTLYNAVREYLHSRRKSTTNDFTKEEFKKLDNILEGMFPRMHTPYSKVSENGIKSAIPMTARKSEHINMTSPYRSEVKLIPLDKVSSGKFNVQGVHTRLEPPGVRATSLGTHGLDAKTSQDAQKDTEALNNHDAHLTGIEAIALQARRLNDSLWNNLMEYSPMQEAAETLARTIAGFKEVRNKLEEIDKTRGTDVLASGVVAAVVTSMQSFEIGDETGDVDTIYSLDHLEGAYIDLYIAALEADYKKYLFMSEMKAVSQYAFQGGAYIVTEEQRKLALAKAQEIASTKSLQDDANIQEVYSNVEESIRSKNTLSVSDVYPLKEIPDPKRVETKDKAIRLQVLESLKGILVMRNQKGSREYALVEAYQEATLSPDSALWNALSDVEKLHIINYVQRITGETYRIKALRNKLLKIEAIAPKQSNTPVETGEVTAGKDVAPVAPEIKVEPEVEAAPVTPTKPAKKVYRRQEQLTMPVVENSDKPSMDFLSQEINRVLRTKGKMDKFALFRVFRMKQQGTENEALFSAYKEIGMRLLKAMPNIQVILVTPDTVLPKEVVFGEDEYGKYVASPTGDTIYLLESANIDVTAMLHEMVHASLTRMLHAHPEYANEVKALMEHVKAQMTPQELETFKAAFVDVDEFIAYGMTHRGFQNMLQTKKGRTLGNQVLDAFQGFMDMVLKALGFPANKGTALRDILVLGAELIEKAEKQQANKIADTLVRNITMTVGDVRDYSTQDIFDALDTGSIERGFASHLRGMLTGMVSKMYGPFGILGKEAMENQPMGPMDIYLNSRGRGSLAFVSEIRAAGVNISDQEAYVAEQIEATVRASLEANTGQLTSAYTQLARMYDEAYKRFPTPEALLEDWSNAPVEEQEQATALHTFLFDLTLSSSGKSNHLAKFAAMVLAVEEVSDKFDYASYNRDSSIDTTTFFGRLLKWFDGIMDWVESHASKTYLGQPANEKVKALINTMVEIEAKRRALVYSRGARKMPGEYIDEGAAYLTNKAKEGLVKFSNSRVFTNSKNVYLRSGGSVLNILATDTLDNYGETLRKFRERLSSEKHGMIAALLTEVRGDTDNTSIFYKMLKATKHLESERQAYITKSANMVNSAFLNSAKFTKEHNEAITTYFIHTGMYSLMDKYSMAELEQMLSNPKLLVAAIEEHEKALVTLNPKFANFWIVAGKSLGHHMITGKAKFQHIGNPYVIARFGGTSLQGKVPESMAKDAQVLIDRLASLQAILSGPQAVKKGSKTGMGQRALAASIMREENSRQANGVEFLLRLHRQQLGAAKESLFKDSEALMVKGYSPNTVDPHISIKVATAEELPELKKIGFKVHGEVSKDPNDPDQTAKYLCSIEGSGMRPWLSGIFSTTNLGARGNKQLDDNLNPFTVAGVINRTLLDNVVDAKERDMRSVLYGTYRGFDPRKVKPDYMVPVFNADMQVTNYRYMMSSNNLNNILKRDNRFGHIMGTLEGNTFDKMTSPKQNALAAQALYDHYQANKATDAGAYVYVGFDSTDPELQDIANMFPEHTRQAIRKIWGMNGMMVRRDMLDINFGYRKWSATEALFQSAAEKNYFAKLVVRLFEYLFALNGDEVSRKTAKERAKRWLLNAGDIWEELVAETKDIIVIKTGTVMMHNIVSNFLELKAFGVPMWDILKHHHTALKASIQYKKDKETLFNLETQLNTGFTQGKDKGIARQIVILKDRIVNSPVHRLMEEGLMPTIVEDISNNEDIYSRKTALVEKLEGVTSRIPKSFVKGARFVYMAHDTFLYKKLAEATQLSDFVARYTLYQHDTTKRHALSHEEAIRKTSDAFVNYDIPSHRKLQWGNDMGLVMFTKYYIRIQKVIMRTMRDNPLNATLMLLLNNYMDSLPMLYDSGILGNSYGSGLFSAGALEYPGTLDNLLTVNAVM